ncbi:kynurenine 3-monooxygenase [Catalinimonas alkaloidigena]|uniref:FAD-dependent oxidoreductase n=1 Tax=Catalinimonas alkaloidigena TaxID=1075417 RepID=UPI00240765A1|nr:NAD(P)/FAD-dependent oxidoreductase [Catalinimonas alkaloidigena]MDF9800959.1 kynurenine 3-monooxygenase [Catalinimonas alkaloidigena]
MHTNQPTSVNILGAGLAGSLLSLLLTKQGYQVSVYEKRDDPRNAQIAEGRSINLALSLRGWEALRKAGIEEVIRKQAIPMKGRMIHNLEGETHLQPYSADDKSIYSVSRAALNNILISQSEEKGVTFNFNHLCEEIDLAKNEASFRFSGETKRMPSDLLIGTDGAFSALRSALQKTPRFNYSQHYIAHGYKELSIPPTSEGEFAMEPNALHIWPRGGYMLIALPNMDKSFTCTLFLPYEGERSFAALQNKQQVRIFFENNFPDTLPLMPDLEEMFFQNPTSDLVTIRCYPWTYNGKQLLLGDAAHAIVPFYGQGMNAAFEDCRLFTEMLYGKTDDLAEVIFQFQKSRKPDADAIAELALQNFIEMRDLVADETFVERKKIEKELFLRYPEQWTPLYNMVTFSHRPYAEALSMGKKQDAIMQQVMQQYSKASALGGEDYAKIIAMLDGKQEAGD